MSKKKEPVETPVLERLDHRVKAKILLSGSEFNVGRYVEATDDCLFIMTDEQIEPIYFNLQEADLLIAAIRAVQRDFQEP